VHLVELGERLVGHRVLPEREQDTPAGDLVASLGRVPTSTCRSISSASSSAEIDACSHKSCSCSTVSNVAATMLSCPGSSASRAPFAKPASAAMLRMVAASNPPLRMIPLATSTISRRR
jgi:hypothetical protein